MQEPSDFGSIYFRMHALEKTNDVMSAKGVIKLFTKFSALHRTQYRRPPTSYTGWPYEAFFLHLLRKTISEVQDFLIGETNFLFCHNQITMVKVTDQTRCERLTPTICPSNKASDQLPHFHVLDPQGLCTKKPDICRAFLGQSLTRRNDRMGLISLIRSVMSTGFVNLIFQIEPHRVTG